MAADEEKPDYAVVTGKLERLNRLMSLHFASFFDDLSLTSTQALALEFVMEKAADGDVFQKDLEVFLSVRGSSVTSLVNNLERAGYLSREAADFDGRYRCLVPTRKALDLRGEITRRIDAYMDSLFVGIPAADLKAFESVVDAMERNVRR